MADSCELLQFLESRNPFSDNCSLRSIVTGINAGISVNVDTAKDVGQKIFEARYAMRLSNKPALADAIWVLIPKDVVEPTGQSHYVLDGGSLVHRIPWQRGTTYTYICRQYTN